MDIYWAGNVEKNKFTQQVACRLTKIIREKGYGSSRSQAGIDINKLAQVSGCSYQMARKYALGLVLPEIHVIITIANWLNVSPGAILFGTDETPSKKTGSDTTIEIEPAILKYILNKSVSLFFLSNDTNNIINFIVDTVYDAAHLDVDTKTIHKIIDMMISSAILLKKSAKEDKENAVVKSK